MYDDQHALAHPFLYTTRKDSSASPHPAWLRDQLANFELTNAVSELGIARPASAIVNMPPPELVEPRQLLGWNELLQIDTDHLRPGDFLILTTRVPKEDIEEGNRMWVEPGQTDLEYRIFRLVERYLEKCARNHIRVSPSVRKELPKGCAGHANFSVYQRGGFGFYREMNEGRGWRTLRPGDPRREKVPAFLIRIDSLYEGGPGCFIAFSMDSLSTAAWCWRLRRDLSHLLLRPGFHFYDLTPREMPERPTDFGWAAGWGVERVVATPPATASHGLSLESVPA
ncbi:MAG TPA: hypothetical protein VKB65_04470 [Myxococcota bacterium]|nr:hypothetical protein [Myxococcota bacterium]